MCLTILKLLNAENQGVTTPGPLHAVAKVYDVRYDGMYLLSRRMYTYIQTIYVSAERLGHRVVLCDMHTYLGTLLNAENSVV